MCGIIAAFNKQEEANEDILLQFEDQSSRGTNGFGAIFLDDTGKFSIARATGQIKAILDVKLKPSKMIIFHHRQPSSSKNKISQTHPIKISSKGLKHDYYLVHNGVIQNDDKRKEAHEKDGYTYSTEVEIDGWGAKKEVMYNDSESLGYDLARFIEGKTDKIETVGSAAFIIAQVKKKKSKIVRIYFGRNTSNPLKLAADETRVFLSSEGPGEDVEPDKLFWFAPDSFKIEEKKIQIATSTYNPTAAAEAKEAKSKDDDDDDDKPAGVKRHYSRYTGYGLDDDDYYPARKTYRGSLDADWMSYEEEEEVDKFFTAAELEIENLKEALKEAASEDGESLYLIDTEDIVKKIAVNLARAVEYARNLKISNYIADAEESIIKGDEKVEVLAHANEAEDNFNPKEAKVVTITERTQSK